MPEIVAGVKIDGRHKNGGKRLGAGKPFGTKNNTYNRKKPYPTKITEKKLVDLLGNHKLSHADAAKILDVHPNSIYQAMQRYKIDVSGFDIDKVKSEHETELIAINALVRGRIFDKLLNADNLNLIEMTAILDRSFQQMRELQGKGHSSVNIFTMIVAKADEKVFNTTAKVIESTTSSMPISNNQPIVQHTA